MSDLAGLDMRADGLERIIDAAPVLDQIFGGMTFGEGPLWDPRGKRLIWVDIIGDTIWQWQPGIGTSALVRGSRHANGLTFDAQGRVVVAGWSSRTIWRIEPDGSFTTVAWGWEGKKFNSPNDIVTRSDGTMYWTDSYGGVVIPGMEGDDLQRYLDIQGVFALGPSGEVRLVVEDCVYPNGLAFSPDESILYVNDSRQALIREFDVHADGSLGAGRLFHRLGGTEPGVADGMKIDVEGNVYCTGPAGIHVLDAAGNRLGRIRIPGHSTNLAWGDEDLRSLYVTTYSSVFRLRLKIPGIPAWPKGLPL